MAYIVGTKSYLALATEDIWGINPFESSGSGSGLQNFIHLPVTSCNLRFNPENRQANPYLGIHQRKHSTNFRGMVAGQIVCPLYGTWAEGIGKSLAQYLLDWAIENHESNELPSKTAVWTEGPGVADKEFNGLRVNSATLAGSDDSGTIDLTLDLMGKEDGNAVSVPPLPDNRNKCVDFNYALCTFALAGSAVKFKSFNLQVQHALQVHYLNSSTPTLLIKTQRVVTLQAVPVKDANTYDAYRRALGMTEFTGQITARGLHNGTGTSGTYTTLTIDFPRLSFINAEDQGGKQDVIFQNLNLVALKPDTSSNDMSTTWGQA